MPPHKRVVIADDHSLILTGVANLLQPKYEVVGLASNGRELVAAAKRLRPDVVVLDIAMPEFNGIEAARQLAEQDPKLRIVFLRNSWKEVF